MNAGPGEFAARVVRWQASHGRSELPWQNTRDPYRVWLSEIMLQQTQVAAVRGYYARFLQRFPDVAALAAAQPDEVLAAWSGLGYYSRARNLHRCAQQVVAVHGGRFPDNAAALATLPGIGRSTAAAIAAFCFGERVAILDGNVKRVLTRLLGFEGDLAASANERRLWAHADALLPRDAPAAAMPAYTQGLMDLGATLCTARRPQCLLCPVADLCKARAEGRPEHYPVKTRTLRRRAESWWLLLARTHDGAVWLQRRPDRGVWAGLYCPPVFGGHAELAASLPPARQAALRDGEPFLHVLTHRDLHLHPVWLQLPRRAAIGSAGGWHAAADWPQLGLPAPVRRLLAAVP